MLLAATASEGRFDALTEELVRFFLADPDRARLVIREALDRPTSIRSLLEDRVKPWIAAVAGYVQKGREHGEHHGDVDAEAYVLAVTELVIVAIASSGITSALLAPGPGRREQGAALRLSSGLGSGFVPLASSEHGASTCSTECRGPATA